MNTLAPLLVLALVLVVYLVIWQVRDRLRAMPEAVPVAVLALMVATMCGNKVLSPQHLIWVLPVVALALVTTRWSLRIPALLMFVAMILTQIDYPQMYYDLYLLKPTAIFVVAARNVTLLAVARDESHRFVAPAAGGERAGREVRCGRTFRAGRGRLTPRPNGSQRIHFRPRLVGSPAVAAAGRPSLSSEPASLRARAARASALVRPVRVTPKESEPPTRLECPSGARLAVRRRGAPGVSGVRALCVSASPGRQRRLSTQNT